MKLVTIVIATFNAEETLATAIQSVLNQTYKNIECLVVDGASKDNTIPIVESYQQEDNRIRYISEPDGGIYDAFNKGWKLAKGDWILYLGADDELLNDGIEILMSASDNADVVYGECFLKFANGKMKLRKNNPLTAIGRYLPCCHQSIIMRKGMFLNLGGFDEQYKILGDLDLMQRVYIAKAKFREVNKPISIFFVGGVSTGNLYAEKERYSMMKSNSIVKYPRYESLKITLRKILIKIKHRINKQ